MFATAMATFLRPSARNTVAANAAGVVTGPALYWGTTVGIRNPLRPGQPRVDAPFGDRVHAGRKCRLAFCRFDSQRRVPGMGAVRSPQSRGTFDPEPLLGQTPPPGSPNHDSRTMSSLPKSSVRRFGIRHANHFPQSDTAAYCRRFFAPVVLDAIASEYRS